MACVEIFGVIHGLSSFGGRRSCLLGRGGRTTAGGFLLLSGLFQRLDDVPVLSLERQELFGKNLMPTLFRLLSLPLLDGGKLHIVLTLALLQFLRFNLAHRRDRPCGLALTGSISSRAFEVSLSDRTHHGCWINCASR